MKKTIIFASILTFLCQTSVYADTNQALSMSKKTDQVSVGTIVPDIVDNSNILVEVTLTTSGGESSVIYTGTLGGFAEGKLNNIDISEVDAVILFDWETDDTYVIKKVDELIQEQIKYEIEDFDNIDIDENTVQSNTIERNVGVIEYDVEYEIINNESISMEIDYNIFNGSSEAENLTLIAALYEDNKLCDVEIKQLNVDTMNSNSENITLQLPNERNRYSVKLMVWDDIGTMKPLGNVKHIIDLDEYAREKILYITADTDDNFNIFMNSSNAKGENYQSTHTIKYDATKMIPTDLCGLTYEKELSTTEVQNTNVVINNVDTVLGKIEYKFTFPEGRNTGTQNFVRFKALSELNQEPIIYTIQ